MTMPDEPGMVIDEDVEPWHGPVVPVHIQSAKASWGKNVPPEFAGCNTWQVPEITSNPNYVQVANRSYNRHRLRLWIPSVNDATAVMISSDLGTLLNGGGLTILAAQIPFGGGGGMTWESQRPCYATAIGGTAVISTLDETFAEVRKEL